MGYMKIEVKRDDADAVVHQVTIADADILRILITHAEIYFPNGVVETIDGVETPRAPTGLEVLKEAARRLVSDMIFRAITTEREHAHAAAEAAIRPINVTE